MLWPRTLSDEFDRRSNFVAQGDKCDHRGGKQVSSDTKWYFDFEFLQSF